LIAKAVLAKYPDIKLIANEWFQGHPTNPNPEIIDEHYYNNPDWFVWNTNKYDSYDRKGPQIFIGEYAITSGSGKGNLRGAIGEAAWMTGMERNSDIVAMGSYAPLYCNSNHKRWPINLINFDSYRWFGLPSYYVQEMFVNNQGTVSLPVTVEDAPIVKVPVTSGCIGFGSRGSVAEFKDVEVVSPKGGILFKPDFSKIDENWRKSPRGEWTVQDGMLKPATSRSSFPFGSSIFMGDTLWTDYTVTVKARRISGDNGFQIYFRNKNWRDRTRWDIGGSGNTTCVMEYGLLSDSKKISIETGRWYDIKLEIRRNIIKGYLDGKLIQELSDANFQIKNVNASAARDDKSGDFILKIVNSSTDPVKTKIDLKGAGTLSGSGKAIVLTSDSPLDENTLEEPTKVSPKTETLNFSGNSFTRSFPGNSLTVIRIPTKGEIKM
jgi:alpha-L-arabinofuranosidase